jgi:anti-sigma regulatory factor (Ser/Thr protein kinase)
VRLGADVHAAGEARTFVAATLRRWGLGEAHTGDVLLAVSELVSNAVQHGSGRPRLQLSLVEGRLEIRVRDDGVRRAQRRAHDLLADRGRGLQIVATVADTWGQRSDGDGKWVWAVFTVAGADPSEGEPAS